MMGGTDTIDQGEPAC